MSYAKFDSNVVAMQNKDKKEVVRPPQPKGAADINPEREQKVLAYSLAFMAFVGACGLSDLAGVTSRAFILPLAISFYAAIVVVLIPLGYSFVTSGIGVQAPYGVGRGKRSAWRADYLSGRNGARAKFDATMAPPKLSWASMASLGVSISSPWIGLVVYLTYLI